MKKLTKSKTKLKGIRRKDRSVNNNGQALTSSALQNINLNESLPSDKVKRLRLPSTKYSHREMAGKFVHNMLSIALPLAVYAIIKIFYDRDEASSHLTTFTLAALLILLSKWQIFLVKPRFWWANIKFSAVDLIFKLSIVVLMVESQVKIGQLTNKNSLALHILQLMLVGLYLFWNIYLRKLSQAKGMLAQAMYAQVLGLLAIGWLAGFSTSSIPIPALILLTWVITYAAAQHVMYSFEETAIPQLAGFWALFATALSFLQYIWGQNFLFFSGLIYLPLIPFVISFFGYLASSTHSFIEDTQNDEGIPKIKLTQKKELLNKQAGIACLISVFLAVLIAVK
ncbi:MAG: hypothetical protein QG623_197 [Patescibacteria group bacterium]|nr:hypothetical protein [Patescibacteria group bacterium]